MEPLDYLKGTLEETAAIQRAFLDEFGPALIAASRAMAHAIEKGGKILFCGNGGSAADAQHAAAEMIGRMLIERRPLAAIALSTDTSNLTAVGNDYGFEYVFERQVRGLARPGDVLVAISTSGKSPNVIRAVEAARELGVTVIGLTGGDGGPLRALCDHFLSASKGKNSSRIQETHIFAIHGLVDLLDRYFLKHG